MSAVTSIEWTAGPDGSAGRSWNPVTGCEKVSPGCAKCYAEGIARRFAGGPGFPHGFAVTLRPERLRDPLTWRKPTRVFVNSMSDLWHKQIPTAFIAAVFAVMAATPQHTYLVLTKRPARMRALLEYDAYRLQDGADPEDAPVLAEASWPLPNVHLGVSAEDQHWFGVREGDLWRTPNAVPWISAEPLLRPVHLGLDAIERLAWLVIGGESGPGATPMELAWARSLVEQCRSAEIPVYVKQLGSAWARTNNAAHPKGGDPEGWPEDLRIREYPRTVMTP
jgi:protein gp37